MVSRRRAMQAWGGGALAAATAPTAAQAVAPAERGGADPAEPADSGGSTSGTLVVVEKSGHAVAFFDAANGTLLERIDLGEYPHEMVVDSARRYGYIGHYGVRMSGDVGEGGTSVFVVDLHERELVRTIDLHPFNRLHGIAIDEEDRLYVLSEEKAVLVRIDDPAEAEAPSAAVHTGGIKTHMVTTTRDGSTAYVTGLLSHTVSRVNPHDASAAPVIACPGRLPESCALSEDEKVLYVGAREDSALVALDARTLKERRRQEVEGDPLRVYVIPGSSELLTTDIVGRTVTRYDDRLRELDSLPFEGTPAGISFHPEEPTAFITLLDTDEVAVVDLQAFAVTGTISTGSEPDVTVLIWDRLSR